MCVCVFQSGDDCFSLSGRSNRSSNTTSDRGSPVTSCLVALQDLDSGDSVLSVPRRLFLTAQQGRATATGRDMQAASPGVRGDSVAVLCVYM